MDGSAVQISSCGRNEARSLWLRQRVAILRNNPNFCQASFEYAHGIVGVFEGQYMANKVMANAARQVICMAIAAMHYGRDEVHHGASISNLQHVTTELGLCSKSTTAATVNLLENIGHVTRVKDEADHRSHLIEPTGQLVSVLHDIIAVCLSAADRLFPLRRYRALLDSSSGFLERYFATSLHSLFDIEPLIIEDRRSRLFATSDSGEMLLCKLMAGRTERDQNVVSLPFDEIGHLYGVSRTHIRRLMKKAETEGMVRLMDAGGRHIELLPPLKEVFNNIVASHIAKVQFDIHLANEDYDLLPAELCA